MNIKNQILSSAISCLMAVSIWNPLSCTIKAEADFEQTANEVVSDIVLGWNLGNTLDARTGYTFGCDDLNSELSWQNPKTSKAMIDEVKAQGFNAVRIPVTWHNHMNSDYSIDEKWMARVKEVVDYVIDNDMYCIINVHHDTAVNGWICASTTNLAENKERSALLWQQIADEFNNYGDKLIFEGFNEILDENNEWVNPGTEALDIVNEYNQLFVDTVRKTGGNNAKRCLMVNTYAAGGNNAVTKGFVLPDDTIENKLIVSAHIYQPHKFISTDYPDVTTWTSTDLDTYLNNMYTTFVQNDVPVIIGEFGCADKNNTAERVSWTQYYVDTCTDMGIKCFWWDAGDYALLNRNMLTWKEPDIVKAMVTEANGGDYVYEPGISGDINDDGEVTITDAVMLKKWLICDGTITNYKNADICKDGIINVFDLCILKRMLTAPENLCADPNNWAIYVNSSTKADATSVPAKNGITMEINNSGINKWDVQASYKNLTFEEGVSYKIAFDYTATTENTVWFTVLQDYGDYMDYYNEYITFTPDIQHYEVIFTMKEPTDEKCQITFNYGGIEVNETSSFTVSNLEMVQIK